MKIDFNTLNTSLHKDCSGNCEHKLIQYFLAKEFLKNNEIRNTVIKAVSISLGKFLTGKNNVDNFLADLGEILASLFATGFLIGMQYQKENPNGFEPKRDERSN